MKNQNSTNPKSLSNNKVRVRFAPSPTGYLHVGGARTAYYNYLYALKHEGDFIIRVEDTDEARSSKESLISMIQDMKWLNIEWDEGPINEDLEEKGSHGPYLQSQRKDIYQNYLQKLLDSGHAYYCFLTEDDLDKQREEAKKDGKPFRPLSPYRDWTLEEAQKKMTDEGLKGTIRFKNNHEKDTYDIQDLVRGEVSLPSSMIGDFVIARSSGTPVYNFVCALDDALMEITHVFRAEEHLNNTLRQLMIMEALEIQPPQYGHLSIMLGEDRQKLSKRHGAASVSEFREEGYLPEALTNFITLMGWSSPTGEEILTKEEMVKDFSADRFNPASAVFDKEKLRWMNAQYLRSLSPEKFWSYMSEFIPNEWSFPEDESWKARSFEALKTSMETFKDGVPLMGMLRLGGLPELDEKSSEVISWDSTKDVIQVWVTALENSQDDYITAEGVDELISLVKDKAGVKGKFLFMPIRVASIGKAQGTEIKDLIPLIPRNELAQRGQEVLAKIEN